MLDLVEPGQRPKGEPLGGKTDPARRQPGEVWIGSVHTSKYGRKRCRTTAWGYPRLVERRFGLLVLALLAASLLSMGTLVVRMHEAHGQSYWFLIWNLFLAWVPLVVAYVAFRLARRRIGAGVGGLVVLWLLFFPNAPYMLTDFKHLTGNGEIPLWYDALMLSSFAWTALMLGFLSLYLIQAIVAPRASAAWGWVVVVGALALASFGVYIGRFAGFNSWDALIRPRYVLSEIGERTNSPIHDPKMLAALLALTASLVVGYLVVYAFAALRLDAADE